MPSTRMPSSPKVDGDGAAKVLAEYTDWNYTDGGEDPADPGPEPASAPAPAASRAGEPAGGGGPPDWAGWVKLKLVAQLEAQLAASPSPRRRKALEAALLRVRSWR
jgi:hypothetical protein